LKHRIYLAGRADSSQDVRTPTEISAGLYRLRERTQNPDLGAVLKFYGDFAY